MEYWNLFTYLGDIWGYIGEKYFRSLLYIMRKLIQAHEDVVHI